MFRQNFYLVLLLLSHISAIWSAAARNESLILARIRGGNDVDITGAAFQVSIRRRDKENEKYGAGFECGGSLISENVVLTAANCFLSNYYLLIYGEAADYVVVMGNSNYMDHDENTLQFDIKKFSAAKFNELLENDIALAFLDGKVPKTHPTAKPIALNSGARKNGILCRAYGWGVDASDEFSENLQVVYLPLITTRPCQDKTVYGKEVRPGMFCAGYLEGGRAACRGDVGGPLTCGRVQFGIMSWIDNCGEPRKPAVFTDVSLYKTWILKHVNLNNGAEPTFGSIF